MVFVCDMSDLFNESVPFEFVDKGNMKASEELIKVKQRADILNVLSKESDGYAYWQAVEYCSRAVNYIEEKNDASALEYTNESLFSA